MWRNAVGEAKNRALRVDLDRQLKLEFHGAKIASDAGLFAGCLRRSEVKGESKIYFRRLRRELCKCLDYASPGV